MQKAKLKEQKMFCNSKEVFVFCLSVLSLVVSVQAESKKDVMYYPGDEFAQVIPITIGSVDTNNIIVPEARVVYNKRMKVHDPGGNSFEQRVMLEFKISDLKAELENRLIKSILLKSKITDNTSAQKGTLEIWGYRETANGKVSRDDFDTGKKLGEIAIHDGEFSFDVTDFVASIGEGWAGFRIQMLGNITDTESQDLTFENPRLYINLAKQIFTMRGKSPASPPLSFMDDTSKWNVKMVNGAAKSTVKMETSREITFYGQPVTKIIYSGADKKSEIHISPLKPLPIPNLFSAADLWSWANSFNYANPRKIFLVLGDSKGKEISRPLSHGLNQNGPMEHFVNFEQPWAKFDVGKRYFLKEIVIKDLAAVPQDFFYLSTLSFYMQNTNIKLPNIKSDLKLPNDPKGMVPPVKAEGKVEKVGPKKFIFTTSTPGDQVEYIYQPNDGTMDDITIIHNNQTFKPMTGGGLLSAATGAKAIIKGKMTSLVFNKKNNSVKTTWSSISGKGKYKITLSLIDKSLVIDISSNDKSAAGFDFGSLAGLQKTKLVEVPYFNSWGKRNGVLGPRIVNSPGTFFFGFIDHYFSNANEIYAQGTIDKNGNALYNGGSYYFPDTKNKRHDLNERIVLTASSEFQEVLPNIPNPVVFDRQKARDTYFSCMVWPDVENIKLLHDVGMEDLFLWVYWWNAANQHWSLSYPDLSEPGNGGYDWFIPKSGKPSPKIWRKMKPRDFVKLVHSLGWKFGLYTYYNDISPTAECFNRDWMALADDNQPRMGCLGFYWVRSAFLPQFQKVIAESIKKEWGTLDGTYVDVSTGRCPWGNEMDMDGNVPDSGRFMIHFRKVAQMLNQEVQDFGQAWAEGTFPWIYAGLHTGSYGTLFTSNPGGSSAVPMLPEFDLRRIHQKSQLIGMGSSYHFFFQKPVPRGDYHNEFTNQYHAAVLGYGHVGQYQGNNHGNQSLAGVAKTYYLFSQLQKLYAFEPIKTIEYFNGKEFVSTSQAIEDDSYLQGRIHEVYENGVTVYVNYNAKEKWTIQVDGKDIVLPPWGFYAFHIPTDTLVYSIEKDGGRCEYSRSAKYVYADSWDKLKNFDEFSIKGAGAIKKIDAKKIVFIPLGKFIDGKTLRVSPENFGVEVVKIDIAKFFPSAKKESLKVIAVDPEGKKIPYDFSLENGCLVLNPHGHNINYEITHDE